MFFSGFFSDLFQDLSQLQETWLTEGELSLSLSLFRHTFHCHLLVLVMMASVHGVVMSVPRSARMMRHQPERLFRSLTVLHVGFLHVFPVHLLYSISVVHCRAIIDILHCIVVYCKRAFEFA